MESSDWVEVSDCGIISSGCGFLFAAVASLHLLVDVGLSCSDHWQSTPDGGGIATYTLQTELSFRSCVSLSYRINFFFFRLLENWHAFT